MLHRYVHELARRVGLPQAPALSYLGMFGVIATLPVTVAGDRRPLLVSVVLIVLPTVVTLLQLALARSREYGAASKEHPSPGN